MNSDSTKRTIADLVFVGLNRHVVALDRYSGELVWQWKSPKGTGFVNLLLDGDRLVVSAGGYMYCLDPLFGQEVWNNPLTGFGVGVTSLVSLNGSAAASPAAATIEAQRQSAATTAATSV